MVWARLTLALACGAHPLAGWSAHTGKILKAGMAWDLGKGLHQVFCRGGMLEQARFPDPGPDPMHPVLAKMSLAGNTITMAYFMLGSDAWVGAAFHGLVGESWTACPTSR